jgi:hypothetical protein
MWKIVLSAALVAGLSVGGAVQAGGRGSSAASSGHSMSHYSNGNYSGNYGKGNKPYNSMKSYYGKNHNHWSHYCWNGKYGCNFYWCPWSLCYYYWYGPGNCYYPISYIDQYPPVATAPAGVTQVVNLQSGAVPAPPPGSGPVMPYAKP